MGNKSAFNIISFCIHIKKKKNLIQWRYYDVLSQMKWNFSFNKTGSKACESFDITTCHIKLNKFKILMHLYIPSLILSAQNLGIVRVWRIRVIQMKNLDR